MGVDAMVVFHQSKVDTTCDTRNLPNLGLTLYASLTSLPRLTSLAKHRRRLRVLLFAL